MPAQKQMAKDFFGNWQMASFRMDVDAWTGSVNLNSFGGGV
jgi:hypothetical protein